MTNSPQWSGNSSVEINVVKESQRMKLREELVIQWSIHALDSETRSVAQWNLLFLSNDASDPSERTKTIMKKEKISVTSSIYRRNRREVSEVGTIWRDSWGCEVRTRYENMESMGQVSPLSSTHPMKKFSEHCKFLKIARKEVRKPSGGTWRLLRRLLSPTQSSSRFPQTISTSWKILPVNSSAWLANATKQCCESELSSAKVSFNSNNINSLISRRKKRSAQEGEITLDSIRTSHGTTATSEACIFGNSLAFKVDPQVSVDSVLLLFVRSVKPRTSTGSLSR